MKQIKENILSDKAIIINCKSLPNSIIMSITVISNYNDKANNEGGMVKTFRRDTGYPLIFRIIPGNIVDMNTMIRSVDVLDHIGNIETDYILSDAGYYTLEDINELYRANIDFLMRLPEKYRLYRDLINKYGPELKQERNMVKYNDRVVYIKQIEVTIGDGHKAYAFLGYDLDQVDHEMHKCLNKSKEMTIMQIQKKLESMGYFILISSLSFPIEGVLPAYYTRQLVEQYFDLSKESSKLTPLRVHSEEAVRGHLLLLVIAAIVNMYIQKKENSSKPGWHIHGTQKSKVPRLQDSHFGRRASKKSKRYL